MDKKKISEKKGVGEGGGGWRGSCGGICKHILGVKIFFKQLRFI